jgi:hypothetical protein
MCGPRVAEEAEKCIGSTGVHVYLNLSSRSQRKHDIRTVIRRWWNSNILPIAFLDELLIVDFQWTVVHNAVNPNRRVDRAGQEPE